MQSRRSFFARFAATIAIVALAPEIAFNRKLESPRLEDPDYYRRVHVVTSEQHAEWQRQFVENLFWGTPMHADTHEEPGWRSDTIRAFQKPGITIYEML